MKKSIQLLLGATLIVFMGMGQAYGQIFAPEGLNIPGTYDSFNNPPTIAAFASSTSASGDVTKISTGTVRWQTMVEVAASGADISGGTYDFLFTSGASGSEFSNKWAGVTVTMNTIQSYTYNTGSDNSITYTNGNWYTINWKDNGYSSTDAIFMETSAEPITISSTSFDATKSDSITVSITLSGSKSSEEKIYVRYSSDSFSTSKHVLSTGSGTSYSAVVPATDDVSFYVLTTTVDLGSDHTTYSGDYDMATIKLDNNSGSNYNYSYAYNVEISGSAGWRLLSLPITGGTVADVSDDTPVQGVTGGDDAGFDANFIIYDETGTFEQPTNTSTAWGDGLGFGLYFFDNTTNGSAELPVTLDVSGSEPSSDVVVDLYSGASGRFTMVGNPFASNVDLANVSANIAISSNMTFWDNEAGSYTSENISGGLVIEPWQGYWVQTANSTSGGQLTFGTADKTSSAADTTHFDKALASNLAELRFSIQSSYNTEKNLTLQVASDASLEWDNYDLIKLGSLIPQNVSAAFVGSLEGEQVLKGIEGIPSSLDEEITLPIIVDLTGESQTLNLKWVGLDKMPSSWSFKLHDYKTGASYDLSSINQYDFEIVIDDTQEKANPLTVINNSIGTPMKAKSGSTPRFGLTVTPNTSVSIDDEVSKVDAFKLDQNYPNPFNPTTNINYTVGEAGAVNITVYNVMGQKVAELLNTTKSAGSYQLSWDATGQASGIYYYRLTAPGVVLTRQMTLIK